MTFDWTVSISDVAIFGGGACAFVRVWLTVRDALRDLAHAVGSADPPTGLIGDVTQMKIEQQAHREWLIRAGLDQP